MLRLPPDVRFVEGPILSGPWEAAPEELAAAAGFAERRQREFLTGRAYARKAMAALLPDPPPLLPDDKRAPVWPAGIIGSITHTHAYCAVAVARVSDHRGLGIDATVVASLKEAFIPKVCRPEEAAELGAEGPARMQRLALVFSAKETFYKLQFPLTRTWLGFKDVRVAADDGEFTVKLLKDAGEFRSGQEFVGLWDANGGLVRTFMRL